SSEPGVDICRTADAKQTSLILLGGHKPLLLEGRLGGTVKQVLARTRYPVAVLVERELKKVERVLVALAGGPEEVATLRVAHQLGQAGVELTLLHVVDPADPARSRAARSQLDALFPDHASAEARVRIQVLAHDSPPDAVLTEATAGYDLIVIGMDAGWELANGILGARRQRILADAPVSVLVVHPPATPGDEATA
ncbi:MAG: universal stress protein, partial [Deltaproteobacteria bacterium]|nr:universal stress protein [Deltaproteobacteria bacterium]